MKRITTFIIFSFILFSYTDIFSQPLFKLHVYGGYNVPLSGLGGNSNFPLPDGSTDRFLFMESGFNAGADFKYFLGKKRNIGLLLNVAYNGYTTGDLQSGGVGIETDKLNDVRIGIGAEYDFLPLKKANPFIGIDLTGNFLSGKSTPDNGGTETNLHSASRFGLAVGAGVDIMINKSFGFVIGAKFDFMNLIGKQDTSATYTHGTEFPLWDKAVTLGGVSYNAINMMDVQFYGGVTFAFGEPKKMVKK